MNPQTLEKYCHLKWARRNSKTRIHIITDIGITKCHQNASGYLTIIFKNFKESDICFDCLDVGQKSSPTGTKKPYGLTVNRILSKNLKCEEILNRINTKPRPYNDISAENLGTMSAYYIRMLTKTQLIKRKSPLYYITNKGKLALKLFQFISQLNNNTLKESDIDVETTTLLLSHTGDSNQALTQLIKDVVKECK